MDPLTLLTRDGHRLTDSGRVELVAVRSVHRVANAFDDVLFATRMLEGAGGPSRRRWWPYVCTTDPGTYWLEHPMRTTGTAALAPGRYLYRMGTHKGRYPCLVQAGAVSVYRDADRDGVLDLDPATIATGDTWSIQVHRANARHRSNTVGKWSAGCVVVADPNDYDELIALVVAQAETTLFLCEV